jgi:hypothetical protein
MRRRVAEGRLRTVRTLPTLQRKADRVAAADVSGRWSSSIAAPERSSRTADCGRVAGPARRRPSSATRHAARTPIHQNLPPSRVHHDRFQPTEASAVALATSAFRQFRSLRLEPALTKSGAGRERATLACDHRTSTGGSYPTGSRQELPGRFPLEAPLNRPSGRPGGGGMSPERYTFCRPSLGAKKKGVHETGCFQSGCTVALALGIPKFVSCSRRG